MTFTEAALEVLRSVGKPLHYKKITEIAIERSLLSHIGKSPEVTMSSRLATMVKKDRGDAPIMKVKPGVFAARDLGPTQAAAAKHADLAQETTMSDVTNDEGATAVAPEVAAPKAPKHELPGGDVFPEEDDDNDPILAGLDEEDQANEGAGRRRRRRRRRGRGELGDGVSATEDASTAPVERGAERPERPERGVERNAERFERKERQRDRDRDRAPRAAGAPSRDAGPPLDWSRQPAEGDLLGKDLADATWTVLAAGERLSVTFARAAELLVRRGRLSGNPVGLAPTVAAAVRADNSRSALSAVRPRFRIRQGRLSLTDWSLPREIVQAEEGVIRAAERQRDQVRRTLVRKLSDLPAAGFAEIIATWLNAEGVVSLRAIRRPTSSAGEFHFAGTLRRGAEETRLAIVVKRDGRDADREQVVDVRGSLHHYGNASAAWIVTTGRISAQAREEVAAGTVPCAVFDGMGLAHAMEKLGIGLQQHVVPVTSLDMDLFEALGDTSESRMDREPTEERPARESAEERRPRGRRSNPPPTANAESRGDDQADASSAVPDEDERSTDVRELAGSDASEQPSVGATESASTELASTEQSGVDPRDTEEARGTD